MTTLPRSVLQAPPPAGASSRSKFGPVEFKGEKVESSIHPDVRHVIFVGGFYGSGKSTFVAGIDEPENIVFVDLEAKGEAICSQLGIENYFCPPVEVATVTKFGFQKIQTYIRTKEIIEALPKDRFTTLIIDGVSILQEAIAQEVELNFQKYNIKQINVETGRMGGAWPGVGDVFNSFLTVSRAAGIRVFGITTELKAKWGEKGPILNKFEMKGVSLLHKMSVLSLILTKGLPQHLGAPSALVLKEALGKYTSVNGRMQVQKRIPPKLPLATMEEVYRYLEEPADYRALRPEEIPSPEEMEPFSAVISKDQLNAMRDLLEVARLTTSDEESDG